MLLKVIEGVQAVEDLPLAHLRVGGLSALLVADVHLGFEEYMASRGVYLPKRQLRQAIEIIERGLSVVDADTLIVVGDVKHLFDKLGRRESKDLHEFLSYATKRFAKVILIRGNHDNFVYPVSKRYGNVELQESLVVGDVMLAHGHKALEIPEGVKAVVMAHEHPSLSLRDPVVGHVVRLPCFLLVPLKNGKHALVLPAAGAYQSGTPISVSPHAYLSPLIVSMGVLGEAKPFAIVGGEGVFELPRLSVIEELLAPT